MIRADDLPTARISAAGLRAMRQYNPGSGKPLPTGWSRSLDEAGRIYMTFALDDILYRERPIVRVRVEQ